MPLAQLGQGGDDAHGLQVRASDTGLHVTGWLPKGANDQVISERAAAKGLDVPPLSRYYLARHSPPGLLLNYASVTPKANRSAAQTRTLAGGSLRFAAGWVSH